MAKYNEALIAPLMAELIESRRRIEDLARENGTLAERMAGLERVRDAAMAHAAELEDTLAAAARPPDPTPDPVPAPLPPTPNVAPAASPRRRLPKWRRWLISVAGGGLVLVVVGSSCQPADSVKHARMCSSARATLSSMARDAGGMEIGQQSFWTLARTVAHTGEKVC